MAELLAILGALGEVLQMGLQIAKQAQAQGRDPTPDELAQIKAAREQAEAAWQASLPSGDSSH